MENEIKVGSEVYSGGGIYTVIRETPTRWVVKFSDNYENWFDKDTLRGKRGDIWGGTKSIRLATQQDRDNIKHKNLAYKLQSKTDFSKLPLEKLEQILALIH